MYIYLVVTNDVTNIFTLIALWDDMLLGMHKVVGLNPNVCTFLHLVCTHMYLYILVYTLT